MKNKLIGREEEQKILLSALTSNESEMVAVFGRRRVGKTFLIKQTYQERIVFELTGLQNGNAQNQLQNFAVQLETFSQSPMPVAKPENWLEAFFMLAKLLGKNQNNEKRVIFLDEIPWLAGRKSGFLMGLSWFWNSWAVNQNVVVVICGSAASWMIQKIVNDRGGLHNRITKRVFLNPFTLAETEAFLQNRNIFFNHYQIIQIYMAMGGIPHYLKEVVEGKSAVQNINDICFSNNGLLKDEFVRLYQALFANADNHLAIVRALAQSRQGLTRSAIVKEAKVAEGGNTSKALEELEQSGFISSYYPFGKQKKEMLYRLTDEYSLFYLRFIERNKKEGEDTWKHLSQTQTAKTWSGYAFENVCLKHISQIKKALGISGVYAQSSSFLQQGNDENKGTQIDLVLDRNDQIINLFEIKFYSTDFVMTESEAQNIRNKISVFRQKTKTKKYLMMVLITTFGLQHNKHSLGLIEQVITMAQLF
jgi:uncharacterized protein